MVLYNMIQVIRGSVAETHDRDPSEISTEMLFRDVTRELITWNTLLDNQPNGKIPRPQNDIVPTSETPEPSTETCVE